LSENNEVAFATFANPSAFFALLKIDAERNAKSAKKTKDAKLL